MKEQLLKMLAEREGAFVSGEEASRLLGVSRTAVWKQIRRLMEEGYTIEACRNRGYRLAGSPDRLTAAGLLSRLRTTSFGRTLHLFDEVGSTQDIAKRLAEEGAPEGTLVIAELQTSGRGRMGRSWLSPKGKGLWMSLVLRPDVPVLCTPQLTLLVAAALCRSLRRQTGLDIGIKWPNDLLVGGRKISGILLESSAEEERLRHVIAGVGVSVNLEPDDYPPELKDKAVSLRMAAGRSFDRTETAALFLESLEELYGIYRRDGFGPIRLLWEAYSVTLGRPAVLKTPDGMVEGVALGLTAHGALRVRTADGSEREIFSAEFVS
ncbi:MAG: biotin--[acetyl-CoA-carboxylase] ligase [Thermobacillus sp. ZCTH02-B1]|uniref:biotin--[acetyl-CoA-carboxylase] ligase n=1 Tax=Thermobacillus sp. ZCTH02-B1 TaxID=1858795 RepID=UPI000B57A560|nr:biotin--[acetyl-CoA-carboxylase] ligase [Thermobacillus sp. ZCTH02-B1]OUM96755.1 MAG: biotin--[acetyl-CoA-carboxylase] ligase [Thermobacillus sp. ZCTH02-B1]